MRVLNDTIEQFSTSAGFHDDMDVTMIDVDFEEVDNVGVANTS